MPNIYINNPYRETLDPDHLPSGKIDQVAGSLYTTTIQPRDNGPVKNLAMSLISPNQDHYLWSYDHTNQQ